ncbi:ABC transporter substrate-binding protein [Marinimicrococcus flavescens]|uniref:ABC transporter substrate-binding protein n=1 Tax=Marinimicrococcus flavescens TaxID=3031815 RepID=A0AAP3UX77_9PROT|nr:ABC transporter substrate-binding protein [Marinimicrococcus flavescens]
MRLRQALLGAAALAVAAGAPAAPVLADLYVPLLTYRTGAYAGSGIPIADGMHDYLAMLNERDGGIGGVRIAIEECETGYDAQKGVECYESTKGKGALVYNPYSTGITLQLIPKASVDKIPVLSMAYGLSAAAEGETFPWIFNPPDTYWDGASAIIRYIADQEGGLDALKGKKIGYIYLDAGYGREPIPLLEQLAQNYGYELVQYPVPGNQMQNQSSQWLNVRRDRPDYMVMWGWGAMNPTAVKEAAKIRFPMEKFIGVWWAGGDDDARPAGEGAKGYKTLNFHGVGADYGAIQDILEHVVKKGQSKVASPDKVGENLYNRGVMNSVFIAEAIRTAQELTGKKEVDAVDVRRGFENLNITEARLKEIGLEGFMKPLEITCEDHSGHNPVYVQQWNGQRWEPASEWFEPMTDVVRPLLEQAARDYVQANQPWPERAEPCG